MAEEDLVGEQKRKSKRFNVSWASRILLADKRIVAARTKDVSDGGLGIELIDNIPVGTEVSIEFSPWVGGKQFLIRAKCMVTYSMIMSGSSGFSCGMRFLALPPVHSASLKQVLKLLE